MLLSNSFFLDSEYKADVEYKINYLSVLKKEDNSIMENIFESESDADEILTKSDLLECLERKIIGPTNDRPFISDSQFLYGTKQISNNYYKILLENHESKQQNTN